MMVDGLHIAEHLTREPVSALAQARAAADALSEASRRRGGPTPPPASAHRGRRR
jgi:hypothetical protein